MSRQGGINRALTWIKKTLEVTEVTNVPDIVLPDVRPVIDVFGWEKLQRVDFANSSGTDVISVSAPDVPAGIIRLVLEASVETSNAVLPFTLWIDHVGRLTTVGVLRPLLLAITAAPIKVPMDRVIYMVEGDSLRGRSSPATGVGETLTLRQRFIDLPIGEYIRGM